MIDFAVGDVVTHKLDDSYVGIITKMEECVTITWVKCKEVKVVMGWIISDYMLYKYLALNTEPLTEIAIKNFEIAGLSHFLDTNTKHDTPVLRKIKQLDRKWEARMKAKGLFYPTSHALNVEVKTTLPPTQMDTPTALGVVTISQTGRTFTYFESLINPLHTASTDFHMMRGNTYPYPVPLG